MGPDVLIINLGKTSVDPTGFTYGYAPVSGVRNTAALAIIRSNNELIIKAVYSKNILWFTQFLKYIIYEILRC